MLVDSVLTNKSNIYPWRTRTYSYLLSKVIGLFLQALVLESVETDDVVVVGNTHLYFHPKADHIRLIQGGMAVLYLTHIVNNLRDSVSVYIVVSQDKNNVVLHKGNLGS